MCTIIVNRENTKAPYDMVFGFPKGWIAQQYDAPKSFYRRHYKQFADSKSVDIVAFDENTQSLWLIEVKDYRAFPKKDKTIIDTIASKVRDTLSCLFIERLKSTDSLAAKAAQLQKIHVVFHLEQPEKPSKLYPQVIDWANGLLKLKQVVRVIDPHPILCNIRHLPNQCAWSVSERRRVQ